MTRYYVAQNGSDSNTGLSWAQAFASIGQVNTAMAAAGETYGDCYLGVGTWIESVNFATRGCTFRGHGSTIWESSGGACYLGAAAYGNAAEAISFVGNSQPGYQASGNTATTTLRNCRFVGCSIGAQGAYISADDCVFTGCTVGLQGRQAANYYVAPRNCLFYACPTAILCGNIAGVAWGAITNNVFVGTGTETGWSFTTTVSTAEINRNTYYNLAKIAYDYTSLTTYATLASWQTKTGQEANSTVADPVLADPTRGLYGLAAGAAGLTQGYSPVGPIGLVYPTSAGVNSTTWQMSTTPNAPQASTGDGWYNHDLTDGCEFSGGDLILAAAGEAAGHATVRSPIYDLGAEYPIQRIDLSRAEAWPAEVVNYDNTRTNWRRNTVRFRGSATTFNQSDANPSTWHEIEHSVFLASALTYRHVQLELTLRTDGAAA